MRISAPILKISHSPGYRAVTKWWLALGLLALTAAQAREPTTPSELQRAGFIDVTTLNHDIQTDMKYAGSDNFVGRTVDGYLAPRCYLQRRAAEALARVQADLAGTGLRLHIWDCYRPERAVQDFVRWAEDLQDQRTKAAHYPDLDKSALLGDYIAPRSGHSRGYTVDLTLEHCVASGHCTSLDMGTDFDFFDPLANTDSPKATAAQRANRDKLRARMEREGFRNYPMEWWHFTLTPEPSPSTYYDLPIR